MTTIAVRTGNLEVPGATIHYELRGRGPLLVLHAAPMISDAFAGAADLFAADHTVLTSDPRGLGASTVDDRDRDVSPELRADDMIRLLEHVDAGPAVLFGSSGGAVSALALATARPDLVSTVIAHEPPLAELLPDRDRILAATDRMIETYLAGDRLGYWNQVLDVAGIVMPPEVVEHVFGGPLDERDAADERYAAVHMDRPTTCWKPTSPPCAPSPTGSSSGSARTAPVNSAIAPRERSERTSASNRHCSLATTSASPRTQPRSSPA